MKTLKVIKIGGKIIDNEVSLLSFLKDFSRLNGPKVLVHGGGKLASDLSKKMNIPVQMIEGRRVTNLETLDIITMVYAGKINKYIVAKLQSFGCNSIGFSGADGNTIIANKRPEHPIDYGFVGDIVKVDINAPKILINNNITNIFSAISHDEKGQLLNTNADTIASELAIAFSNDYEVELYYCFEKKGVLMHRNDENSVIKKITKKTYAELKASNIINEGMIPKLDNCFYALDRKVSSVFIGHPSMLFDQHSNFTTIQKS